MNFLTRIKNIWKLSELEIAKPAKDIREHITNLIKINKEATIVDMSPDVDLS